MSKTIRRVWVSEYSEGELCRIPYGSRWHSINYSNHCASKPARFNTRYGLPVPKWWDKLIHTRPNRAAQRMALRRLLIQGGEYDGDVMFPIGRKPQIYYW